MQDNEQYQVVSTKISNQSYHLLHKLAKKVNMTVYEVAQMALDTLIRYMDSRHNLDPTLEQAMGIFDHMQGWKDSANLCDPGAEPQVHEATYYMTTEGKKGCRAVHVEIPFMGEKVATYNVQEMLERTICLLMPDRYRRLRLLAVEMGKSSLLQVIDTMIQEQEKEEDARAIRAGFEDNTSSDWGIRPSDAPYKQKKTRGAENLADRRNILGEQEIFEDYGTQQDIPTIDELSEMEDAEESETAE